VTITRTTQRAVFAVLLSAVCAAQDTQLEALSRGPLTVWVIGASPPRTNLQAINDLHHATPLTYQETTAGSFGQNASTFGQTSGSYGVPSDSPGIGTPKAATDGNAQTSTPNGLGYRQQTAGTFGQTASTAGSNAGNYGQTSGSFGQTAGSYGTNSGSYGTAASNLGQNAANESANPQQPPPRSFLSQNLEARLKTAFPLIQVRFVDVPSSELKDWLTAASNTQNYPDVLVGSLPDNWNPDLKRRFLVDMVQPAALYNDGLYDWTTWPSEPAVTILAHAPHRDAAGELVVWLDEAMLHCVGCPPPSEAARQPYSRIAVSAVGGLLRSMALAELADPELAAFSPTLGRLMLTTTANTASDSASARVEVLRASANGHIAIVSLRVVASSDAVFGAAHPLLVLRQQADGQWKVLHISLNLPAPETELLRTALMNTSPSSDVERAAGVVGVTLAVPTDNDTRSPTPQLGWDNGGGAGLQVVEWQQARLSRWSDAHLYLVPDQAAKLQTQVTAEFATIPTRYRWRVWSIGAEGQTKISPWRTINIVR
jgi:hypothetical protein